MYLSVGTGIGMGVVIDGELFRGAHGAAGEVGYLPLGGDGARRPGRDAKRRGMLEEAASADAVVRTAAARHGGRDLGQARLRRRARRATSWRSGGRGRGERLALVVATVAAIIDPEFVLLGGGIGGNIDLLRPPLERASPS